MHLQFSVSDDVLSSNGSSADFFSRLFFNCSVYRPSYKQREGRMSLESDFDMAWSEFLTSKKWLTEHGNSNAMHQLAAITAGSIKGLAAQIDQLRSELVEKGSL